MNSTTCVVVFYGWVNVVTSEQFGFMVYNLELEMNNGSTSALQRRLFFFLSLFFVLGVTVVATFIVRGYRFNLEDRKVEATGLLAATSLPDGAQVFADGKLISATNNTVFLEPGDYKVEIKKEGYSTWEKNLKIEKELVTKTEATLFPKAPSLSALTFTGVTSPVFSPDGTKLAYLVPKGTSEEIGIWVLPLGDLPLGFSRDPRQIVNSNLEGASFVWSPNSRQILLKNKVGVYFLLDASQLNPQSSWVSVSSTELSDLTRKWVAEKAKVMEKQLVNLPEEMQTVLKEKADFVTFSPDETKVLYTATDSATIANDLIPGIPASSTQKQERDIKVGKSYIYDIKEDRNFKVADRPIYEKASDKLFMPQPTISWFPTSHHVILVEEGKLVIGDYDGTNYQTVYAGPFEKGLAFPYPNGTRLVILTNFNQPEETPTLYAISLK